MSNDEKTGMIVGAATAVAVPMLLIGISLWYGFVLQQLWGWFGESVTHFRLSLGEAVGVMLFKGLLFPAPQLKKGEEARASTFWILLFGPIVTLVMGWIAHQWLMA